MLSYCGQDIMWYYQKVNTVSKIIEINNYSIKTETNSHHLSWEQSNLCKNWWETCNCAYSITVKSFDICNCKYYPLMWVFIIDISSRGGKRSSDRYKLPFQLKTSQVSSDNLEYLSEYMNSDYFCQYMKKLPAGILVILNRKSSLCGWML